MTGECVHVTVAGMRFSRLLLLSSLFTAPLLACNETAQTAERTVCERLLGCDCREPSYPDVAACVDALGDKEARAQAQADADGRSYDSACAAQLLLRDDDLACKSGDEAAPLLRRCSPCHAIHGDRELGEACEEFADCASELWCVDGACTQDQGIYCGEIAAGERCHDGAQLLGICAGGSFCDVGGTGRCEPQREPGSPCAVDGGCDTLFCREGTCEVPMIGAACDTRCGDKFLCEQFVCVAGPGLGEACVAPEYVCGEGLDCWDPADICQVPQAALCYLYGPDAAAAHLVADSLAYRTR